MNTPDTTDPAPKRGPGRPKMDVGEKKDTRLTIRFSPDEYAKLSIEAARAGRPISQWVRVTLLAATQHTLKWHVADGGTVSTTRIVIARPTKDQA